MRPEQLYSPRLRAFSSDSNTQLLTSRSQNSVVAADFASASKVADQGCILEQTGESIEQVCEGSASPGPDQSVEQSIYSGSDVDEKNEELIW